ncbi:hypothetical protein [Agromyces sp. SYSU T0242]|uniref:hypothetical protein n=1 Tax=Agromyces litoreus TaxID=3158561 RepID=UPI003392A04F
MGVEVASAGGRKPGADAAYAPAPAGRRIAIVGVALVALGFLLAAAFAAGTLPWRGTADAYEHLDYVYQVHLGNLPEPTGHALEPARWNIGDTRIEEGRQYASAHPPLYYWLAAALVGPLLDDGRLVAAVAAIRGLNVALGLAGLIAMAWGGWVVGRRWRAPLAIAVPMAGAFSYAYLRFSAEVYNDMLLTAVSITTVVLAIRILQAGPRPRLMVALSALCVVGMGTKATFVLVLALAVVAVFVGAMLRGRGRPAVRVLRATGLSAVPVVAAAAAFGWFYARNVALSGSWYRSTPVAQVGDREYRGLFENLADPRFYGIVPEGLFGKWARTVSEAAPAGSAILFIAGATTTIVVVVVLLARRGRRLDHVTGWTIAILAAHLVGQYALQLSHSTGYGQYNVRYFLPATLSFAVLMAFGVTVLRPTRAIAAPAAAVVMMVMSVVSMAALELGPDAVGADPVGAILSMGAAGLPREPLALLLPGAIVALVAAGGALAATLPIAPGLRATPRRAEPATIGTSRAR